MFPQTTHERLLAVTHETARMSYPAGMSRGSNPPLPGDGNGGPKQRIINYFHHHFPLREVWRENIVDYEGWHAAQVVTVGNMLNQNGFVGERRNSRALAAKLLNTFMHQLMKYEECRYLWECLHLPLDRRVCRALLELEVESLKAVEQFMRISPYELRYSDHLKIQKALLQLMDELNARQDAEFVLTSRIELNWLWA